MQKVTSILVLVILAGFFSVSLFAHENCGMMRTTKTASHCGMEMSEMDCCAGSKECVIVAIHPVASAPLNKVDVQKDITTTLLIDQDLGIEIDIEFNSVDYTNDLSPPDIYSGFLTPLLV